MKHFRWDEIPEEQVNDKFVRKLAWDGGIMVAWMRCEKGCYVPAHSHENEQLTFVISGRWEFEMEGRKFFVGPNEMLYIPPNVVHAAEAMDVVEAYDIFSPPRHDWIEKTDSYLRQPKV